MSKHTNALIDAHNDDGCLLCTGADRGAMCAACQRDYNVWLFQCFTEQCVAEQRAELDAALNDYDAEHAARCDAGVYQRAA